MAWHTSVVCSLWIAATQGLQIFPVPEISQFQTDPIAVGSAIESFVPFHVNFLAAADHDDPAVVDKCRTSPWDTKVAVYDNVQNANSYLSISWRSGEGPGAISGDPSMPWSACVLTMPELFEHVTVTGQGNGSCIDVANATCLYGLESMAQAAFAAALGQVESFTPDQVAEACLSIQELRISSDCFKDKDITEDVSNVKVYPNFNPTNGQPFMLGLDDYGEQANQKDVQQKAVSRAWPMIILEAQERHVIVTSMTCPFAGLGSSVDVRPSPDGTCGGSSRFSCKSTDTFYGYCCGAEGLCGWSDDECSDSLGCQPEYGFCDKTVTVTAQPPTSSSTLPKPTAAFFAKTFERQNCDGKVYNTQEVSKNDGFCISTDCQVASIDTAGAGLCADGQVQISYWQNSGCQGDWYGYEYTSRDICKPLWSQGAKFKSLHLRCAEKKNDCISKGTCVADREPAVGICEPPKPEFAFTAKSHYHGDCTGDSHNNIEMKRNSDGFCVNTDCQVASLDIAQEGSCPDGQVQISYWEKPNCQGEWYGYGYSSRGTCRGLWTDGWKFKSLFMRCTDPKKDCINQKTCSYDPEPKTPKC